MEEIQQLQSLVTLLSSRWIQLSSSHEESQKKVQETLTLLSNERCDHQACKALLQQAKEENLDLKNKIASMEQNYNEFAKVSHVVSLEKENAKLKLELSKFKNSSKDKAEAAIQVEPIDELSSSKIMDEANKEKEEKQTEEEEDFYEKKIKGATYYISSLTQKIYEKTEDGEVGKHVGLLQKEAKMLNNMTKTVTKVVWL